MALRQRGPEFRLFVARRNAPNADLAAAASSHRREDDDPFTNVGVRVDAHHAVGLAALQRVVADHGVVDLHLCWRAPRSLILDLNEINWSASLACARGRSGCCRVVGAAEALLHVFFAAHGQLCAQNEGGRAEGLLLVSLQDASDADPSPGRLLFGMVS